MTNEERITSVFEDWYEKHDRGEAPDPEAVIRAHPDLAEPLRARFAGLGVLDQVFQLPSDLPEGTPEEIGDYRILREIGRGGMGVVYEAEQKSMQRRVALKVLSLAVTSTASAVKRFQREARAGGKFHHTNVVPIYGMGQHAGHWYYAMELVEGSPLNTVLDDVRRTRKGDPVRSPSASTSYLGTDTGAPGYFLRVAGMFAGVADALEHAHKEGVIHRDIKPSNLLLEADGTLKLVDFGLAYVSDTGMPSMTMTGDLIGTPVYMSPEQATAKRIRVDHRTDVYSLGATLYEVLTLTPPFQGNNLPDLCNQILNRDPQPASRKNPRIPRDLETIVQKAMEKDREKRYPTAGALARDLQHFALGDPIRARRIGPVARTWRKVRRHKARSALIAAVVVLACVGALFAARAAEESERRRALEYDRLLSRAEEVMNAAEAFVSSAEGARTLSPASEGSELLTQAIRLVPGRPEAYWLRALAAGRTRAERWEDLDAAGRLGLPARTYHLMRAHLLVEEGRLAEAEQARERGARESPTPESAHLEGIVLARSGHRQEALAKFDEALEGAASRRHLRFLIHRRRAAVHEKLGDYAAAMHDLRSLQEQGYDPLSVRVRLAALERRMGREEVAHRKFEEALVAVREDGRAETWVDLCVQCLQSAEPAWQEIATAEAIGVHPTNPLVAQQRVRFLNDSGLHDEALALALGALARHADAHELQGELARTHFASGAWQDAKRAFEEALGTRPVCYHCRIGYGRTLSRLGEVDGAIAAWKQAIEVDPGHAVGHYNLALAYAGAGRIDEAEAAYRRAVRADASYDDALNNLATLLLEKRGRPREALPLIERAVALRTGYAPYLLNHAIMLMAVERYDEAQAKLERALELDEHLTDAMNNLAVLHLDVRHAPRQALPWFLRALEQGPDSALSRYNVGLTYNKLEQYEQALPYLQKAVELDDTDAAYHGQLARTLYYGKVSVERALAEVERAIALSPTDAEAYLLRGILRADEQGRYEDALADFREAVRLDPKNKIAHRNVGFALKNLRRFREALEAFDGALALDEALPEAHRWRAECFEALGELPAAEAAYDRGLAALPDHLVLLNHKGCLLNDVLGRHADALAVFRRVAALAPTDWRYVSNQGHALLGLGRAAEAVQAFDRAERLHPGAPRVPRAHAEALLAHGLYAPAEERFERARKMAPQWDAPWFGLIHLHYERGTFERGLEIVRQAHERWPANVYVRYMLLAYLRAAGEREEAARRALPWSQGESPEGYPALMHAFFCAVAERPEAARAALAKHTDLDAEDLYSIAAIHVLLGDDDAAVRCLERSLAGGYRRHPGSVHDPDFRDSEDPRIPDLLERFEEE